MRIELRLRWVVLGVAVVLAVAGAAAQAADNSSAAGAKATLGVAMPDN